VGPAAKAGVASGPKAARWQGLAWTGPRRSIPRLASSWGSFPKAPAPKVMVLRWFEVLNLSFSGVSLAKLAQQLGVDHFPLGRDTLSP
jgi:hypothetical protein